MALVRAEKLRKRHVLRFWRMDSMVTIRLPAELAEWIEKTARELGVSRSCLIRMELDKARKRPQQAFMRLAGTAEGSPGLSMRKGFSRK